MTYLGSQQHIANLKAARAAGLATKYPCRHCAGMRDKANLARHERGCASNPENLVRCANPNCEISFQPRKRLNGQKTVTCSRACANTLFRSGINHPNWKEETYRSTCFAYHQKKCCVCPECNLVEVHHFDGNHENNDPRNLVPLCPTHHQYLHSRFRPLIEDVVSKYVADFVARSQLLRLLPY